MSESTEKQEVENAGRAPEAEPESGEFLGDSPGAETAFLRDSIAAMLAPIGTDAAASDVTREDLAITLLIVQESHAALEAKMADVEQANRLARDLYEQARAEALAAGYREKAAENRTRILAERVDLLEAQLKARADAAQRMQRTIAAMEKSNA